MHILKHWRYEPISLRRHILQLVWVILRLTLVFLVQLVQKGQSEPLEGQLQEEELLESHQMDQTQSGDNLTSRGPLSSHPGHAAYTGRERQNINHIDWLVH